MKVCFIFLVESTDKQSILSLDKVKLRLYPILKDFKDRENEIANMAIEIFEGFEYCYKLNAQEFETYHKENQGTKDLYLFPSLRPLDGEYAIAAGLLLCFDKVT